MSRNFNETVESYEDASTTRNSTKIYNQSYCNYCYNVHVSNEVGVISAKQGMWFCGPTCQTMYSYDNNLVQYTPELKAELERLRKKFYDPKQLSRRSGRYNKNF